MNDLDAADIVAVLNRHGVKYVVIGAFGAIAQQAPITSTRDIDLTPERSTGNLARSRAPRRKWAPWAPVFIPRPCPKNLPLAEKLSTVQANISKTESRQDLLLSTLANYFATMGADDVKSSSGAATEKSKSPSTPSHHDDQPDHRRRAVPRDQSSCRPVRGILANLQADHVPDRKRREPELAAIRAQLGDLQAELARGQEAAVRHVPFVRGGVASRPGGPPTLQRTASTVPGPFRPPADRPQ